MNVTFTTSSDRSYKTMAAAVLRSSASDDASTNWFCGGYLKIGCAAFSDPDEDDDGYEGVALRMLVGGVTATTHMLTLPRATFTYPLLLNPLHTTHPSFQSCDTDGSITSSSSSWNYDYSDEDWYVQELHAHQTPRYPFATPALPPPSPLRYKLSFTAICDEYSCSLYAASADTAEAYGEPLLTTTKTDSTDDAVTTSGAPELWMSSTTKAAKFTFQNMD